jgi:beta-glucosidase-like glycosyl hydrolase
MFGSAETLDAPAHRALAYQTAAESAVLLVNRGNILPLAVGTGGRYRRVAIIGPNAGCQVEPAASCDAIDAQMGGYTNAGTTLCACSS